MASKKKNILVLILSSLLVLGACGHEKEKKDESKPKSESKKLIRKILTIMIRNKKVNVKIIKMKKRVIKPRIFEFTRTANK